MKCRVRDTALHTGRKKVGEDPARSKNNDQGPTVAASDAETLVTLVYVLWCNDARL